MKYISIILTLFNLTLVHGQTNVNGPITTNTTWTISNSPYIVIADIAIFPNVNLIIEPGVTVKFNDNTCMIVKGSLKAIGNLSDSIIFTSSSNTPTYSIWKGINIENYQGGNAELCYCRGTYADRFVNVLNNTADTVVSMKHSSFKFNNFVIYSYDPSSFKIIIDSCQFESNKFCSIYSNYLSISHSLFSNNEKGIHGWSGPTISISYSTFTGHSIYTFNMSGIISNCTITSNTIGVKLRNDLVLTNNTISNNNIGIEITSNTNITNNNVINNNICNNNSYNVKHTTSSNINLSDNCWCTTDSSVIANSIYDAYDNASFGIIYFTPFPTSSPITGFGMSKDSICDGECVNFFDQSVNYPANWNWTFYGGMPSTSNIQNPLNVCYSADGIYAIKLISSNCYGVDSTTQFIIVKACSGITELYNQNSISIFPNPFSIQTTLQTDKILKNATLTVYNSYGQQAKQIKNISGQFIILFRDNLSSGLYFINLTQEDKTIMIGKLLITD